MSRTARVLIAICLAYFIILFDGSSINVALPGIGGSLHQPLPVLQWAINAYTIPLASVLLTAGAASDRWGARRVLVGSVTIFGVASLLCALSLNLAMLLAGRVLQGIAAGCILPVTLAEISRHFPDPIARARAVTVWAATGSLATLAGQVGGGLFTTLFGWRAIFIINPPIVLAILGLASRSLADLPRRRSSPDLVGQAAATVALTAAVVYLTEGTRLGWAAQPTLFILGIGLAAGLCFAIAQHRVRHPALPPALLRNAAFTASLVNGLAFQLAGYGLQFMYAIYLQERWGMNALSTGLAFLPMSLAWVLGITVLNRRLVRLGPRSLLWRGALISFAGTLILLSVDNRDTWPMFVAGTTLTGLGCGFFGPSVSTAALLAIDPAYAGIGAAVLNTVRQAGMAFGVALLGSLIGLHAARTGLLAGTSVLAACFFAIICLSVRYIPGRAAMTTGRSIAPPGEPKARNTERKGKDSEYNTSTPILDDRPAVGLVTPSPYVDLRD
jgi:MFS family permease